jgi:hypothetical protein
VIIQILMVECSYRLPRIYIRSSKIELENLKADLLQQDWVEDDFYFRTFEVEVDHNDPAESNDLEYVDFIRNP